MKAKYARLKARSIKKKLKSNIESIDDALFKIECHANSGFSNCNLQFAAEFNFMKIVNDLFILGYSVSIDKEYPDEFSISEIFVSWDDDLFEHKAEIINRSQQMSNIHCEVG